MLVAHLILYIIHYIKYIILKLKKVSHVLNFRFQYHIGSLWRKFWIEIHSESIRTIPSHSRI